jgi:hypothetical protein
MNETYHCLSVIPKIKQRKGNERKEKKITGTKIKPKRR